jgi:hypothetical protein
MIVVQLWIIYFIIIVIIIRISCNVYDIAVSLFHPNMTSQETIRLFRIMSVPTMFRLFRVLTSAMLGRRLPVYTLYYFFKIKCFLSLFTDVSLMKKPIYLDIFFAIRQTVGYRTTVFTLPFSWHIHITITYNLPHLRL